MSTANKRSVFYKYLPVACLWLIGLGIGVFYDHDVAMTLYRGNDITSVVFSVVGLGYCILFRFLSSLVPDNKA